MLIPIGTRYGTLNLRIPVTVNGNVIAEDFRGLQSILENREMKLALELLLPHGITLDLKGVKRSMWVEYTSSRQGKKLERGTCCLYGTGAIRFHKDDLLAVGIKDRVALAADFELKKIAIYNPIEGDLIKGKRSQQVSYTKNGKYGLIGAQSLLRHLGWNGTKGLGTFPIIYAEGRIIIEVGSCLN